VCAAVCVTVKERERERDVAALFACGSMTLLLMIMGRDIDLISCPMSRSCMHDRKSDSHVNPHGVLSQQTLVDLPTKIHRAMPWGFSDHESPVRTINLTQRHKDIVHTVVYRSTTKPTNQPTNLLVDMTTLVVTQCCCPQIGQSEFQAKVAGMSGAVRVRLDTIVNSNQQLREERKETEIIRPFLSVRQSL
jgi:hypothetical protein